MKVGSDACNHFQFVLQSRASMALHPLLVPSGNASINFGPFSRQQATRSRRPKSRLERSREEEKIARAKPPEPRIPVVSRPTAARSSHMVEVAHLLSSRAIKDDTGRLMTPHYPVSTHNPLVPRVLAEALEVVSERVYEPDGRVASALDGIDCKFGTRVQARVGRGRGIRQTQAFQVKAYPSFPS